VRIPFLFLLPGVYFLFPVFSDLFKRGEVATVKTLYTFCYEIFAGIAVLMTSYFMIFGHELATSLLGSDFAPSGYVLLFSAPFLLFNFLMQIDFQILSST
jgi:O-antigen/teichoic acid export membrane protein